jgi:polyisoprenoid-binding protein YceI
MIIKKTYSKFNQNTESRNTLIYILLIFIQVQISSSSDLKEDLVYITDSGIVEFTSRVPLHTFTGESNYLTGIIDVTENIVDFYLDLNTLRTGIDRRDRDMFRTLNVNDHPFAEFTGSFVSSFEPESDQEQNVTVNGQFTIHGVTRDIEIDGVLQRQDEDFYIKAEWTLNLNDYDIEPPGILFYRVNEQQEVRIEAVLSPRNRNSN